MYREIKKKKLILENRRPYEVETTNYLEELDMLDFIHSILRLEGSNVSREEIRAIARGEIRQNVPITDHGMIGNYREGLRELRFMADLRIDLTEKALFRLYEAICQPAILNYRKNNPVLLMVQYNPPHFFEVEEQMQVLFHWLYANDEEMNPIRKAAQLHNRLTEIYPFDSDSFIMARVAAQYYLIRHSLPVIPWDVGEQQYYDAIRSYLKKEEIQPIYDILERGVFNKLEVMMQLTAN